MLSSIIMLQLLIDKKKPVVILPETLIYGNKFKLKSIINLKINEQLGTQIF